MPIVITEISMSAKQPLHNGDFVVHHTEGWYGVVVAHPGEDVYKIKVLDPMEYYRVADLRKVHREEVPQHLRHRVLNGS
jgi:hypothetical protein